MKREGETEKINKYMSKLAPMTKTSRYVGAIEACRLLRSLPESATDLHAYAAAEQQKHHVIY